MLFDIVKPNGKIYNFKHKGLLLEITFTDGSSYEYFGVNVNVYKKINQRRQTSTLRKTIHLRKLFISQIEESG
jgi:hypothetical protein